MIKKIYIPSLEIEGKEDQITIIKSGKILKVLVKFSDLRREVNIKMMTGEGETIIDKDNMSEKEFILYPRCNIISGKYENSTTIDKSEYFYFDRIHLLIEKNTEDKEVVIDELIIMYDDLNGKSEQL